MRISDWSSDVCSSDLGLAEDDNLPKVAAEAVAEGTAVVVRHQGIDIVAVFGGFSGALPSRVLDLEFDGDALWLEFSGAHCRRIGALGPRSLDCVNIDVALSASDPLPPARSVERRLGKEWCRTCRSAWVQHP